MKFHFFASLEGNKENYKKIFSILKELGYKPVNNHVFTRDIKDVEKETAEESEMYVEKMLNWVNQADFIIAETTDSCISIGYEIMVAQQKGKPVIVLYEIKSGNIPHTLKGIPMEKIRIYSYDPSNEGDLKEILKTAIEEAKDQMDMRFNFFISPKIGAYLDWIAKHKKLPRAVFLRRLIEGHMSKNKDYNKA